MRVLLIVLCCIVTLPALAQETDEDSLGSVAPRISLPSALGLEKRAVSVSYSFQGASHSGRDLTSHQAEIAAGVTDRVDVALDYHSLDATGRSAANTLDVATIGVQVRYDQELFDEPGALFFGYRHSNAFALLNGATQDPPNADSYTLGAVRSSTWGDDRMLHAVGSLSLSEVGSQSAWTFMGGAGVDYPLRHGLTARGDLALFGNTGDKSSFEAAVSGGLHYESGGFSADVMGTFLPSGAPIAGNPLADASVFVLYPVFGNTGVAQDLASDSIGFYTVRVGYTKEF
jgi:hypothetical protein